MACWPDHLEYIEFVFIYGPFFSQLINTAGYIGCLKNMGILVPVAELKKGKQKGVELPNCIVLFFAARAPFSLSFLQLEMVV